MINRRKKKGKKKEREPAEPGLRSQERQ